jgi:hypothetical protein
VRTELERDAAELQARLAEVEAGIRRSSPRYASISQPESPSLDAIRGAVLGDDTVLLSYALGERRSFLWVVTRTSLERHVLPPRQEIERLVRRAGEREIRFLVMVGPPGEKHARRCVRGGDASELTPQGREPCIPIVDGCAQVEVFGRQRQRPCMQAPDSLFDLGTVVVLDDGSHYGECLDLPAIALKIEAAPVFPFDFFEMSAGMQRDLKKQRCVERQRIVAAGKPGSRKRLRIAARRALDDAREAFGFAKNLARPSFFPSSLEGALGLEEIVPVPVLHATHHVAHGVVGVDREDARHDLVLLAPGLLRPFGNGIANESESLVQQAERSQELRVDGERFTKPRLGAQEVLAPTGRE